MPSWATTVPAAEPSRPQSEAVDEEQLEHDVDGVGRHHDASGLPVPDPAQPALPRERDERHRQPDAAMCRYRTARSATCPVAPSAPTSGGAGAAMTAATATPIAEREPQGLGGEHARRFFPPPRADARRCAVVP